MKKLFSSLVILGFIFVMSCRDSRKEEAETKAAIEKIENVESEIDKISEEVDSRDKELEEALKELDSI